MKTLNIFISHSISKRDRELLKNLHKRLPTGVNTFISEWVISPGTRLTTKIEQAIRKCDAFLAILTKEGVRSQWVSQEIGYAKAENKLIIPVREKGVRMKGFLSELEWVNIDLKNPEEGIEKIKIFLENLQSEKEMRERRKLAEQDRKKLFGIAVAAVAVIVVLLLALAVARE